MMLFIVDLMMGANVGMTSLQLAAITIALSSLFAKALSLPALPLSSNPSNPSLVQVNTSSILTPTYPRPPQEPVCPSDQHWGTTIGHPSYRDCDYILSNMYPKDPLAKPVLRNFYTASTDVSDTMSNVRLPYEQSHSITTPS